MKRFFIMVAASAAALASCIPASALPLAGTVQFHSSDVLQVGDHGGGHRHHHHHHFSGPHQHGGYWDEDDGEGALVYGLVTGQGFNGLLGYDAIAPYRDRSHVSYCYSRYKSYRASDNTFRPNRGPRQQCR